MMSARVAQGSQDQRKLQALNIDGTSSGLPLSGARLRWTLWIHNRAVVRPAINLAAAVLAGILVQIATERFFLPRNLLGLFVQMAVVAIIACPMALVMITACIDVSVGGVVVLSGVVGGLISQAGAPLWLAFSLATLTGLAVGYINSLLVIRLEITSMIATIGTMYVCQGMANILTNGLPVAGVAKGYSSLGTGRFWGVPYQVPITLAAVVVFVLIQRYTVLGRHAVATGSNLEGAFLNGVNVNKTLTLCFLLSGLMAGFGGVLYSSRIGNPTPVMDQDLLFQVIVSCVVGGIALTGGEGTVFGAFTGAVLIVVLNNSLNLLGVSTFWQYVSLGLLLVVAVGLDKLRLGDRFKLRSSALRLRPDGQSGNGTSETVIESEK
ncbi:MAG: ABC transporter permease [Bifidobacteriaceae bacterium]|jgi:ribose/xylose/arabinose/galactoside ABC-type transport system permease subunit|nr:ABC transporter permease [Bifidobacteriaceae bacterium]